jgi:hypothetical protein
MGFRYGGTAWDGQPWVASLAVESLGREADSVTPRPTRSDGTVASERHDAISPTSDHSPKPATGTGTVRAIDITVSPEQGRAWSEHLRQQADSRLKYVIHNERMFSSYPKGDIPPFTWRSYGGSNGHINHIHASVHQDADGAPWGIADAQPVTGEVQVTVEQLQETLNKAGADPQLSPDGVYGPKTAGAWEAMMSAAWESANSGVAGEAGPAGAKGETGDTGPQGPMGNTGAAGDYNVIVEGRIV